MDFSTVAISGYLLLDISVAVRSGRNRVVTWSGSGSAPARDAEAGPAPGADPGRAPAGAPGPWAPACRAGHPVAVAAAASRPRTPRAGARPSSRRARPRRLALEQIGRASCRERG